MKCKFVENSLKNIETFVNLKSSIFHTEKWSTYNDPLPVISRKLMIDRRSHIDSNVFDLPDNTVTSQQNVQLSRWSPKGSQTSHSVHPHNVLRALLFFARSINQPRSMIFFQYIQNTKTRSRRINTNRRQHSTRKKEKKPSASALVYLRVKSR